jgi:predicted nucleic acid-binding protein
VIVADASFWVAALHAPDAHHDPSSSLLRRIVAEIVPVVTPTLALVEVAGAISRRTGNPALAIEAVQYLQGRPWLTISPLSSSAAETAATLAATCSLRGADAVYVALARLEGQPLVTLDQEMIARGATAALVMTPAEWLRQHPSRLA